MSSAARRITALALAALVATTTHDALAEPTPEERIVARTLFEDGRALMKSRDFAQACPKLEESQRLDPGIGTLYNVADCFEGLGRLASAWTTFLDVAEASTRAGEPDRAAVARSRADALAPRLPRVRVTVVQPGGVTLALDQKAFAQAMVGSLVPVDPGPHVLAADAPSRKHWEVRFEAAPAATSDVTVPMLEAAPDEVPTVAALVPSPMAPPPPAPQTSVRWQAPVAVALAGAGVVGLVVGATSGAIAMSDWSSAKPDCPNDRCTTSGAYSSWQGAHTAGVVSTASFLVGGALAVGGAIVWFTRPKAQAPAIGLRADGAIVVAGGFP